MQIIVDDINNLRPLITAPMDTCVTAGEILRISAVAVDQNIPPDFLYLSASGEPFELDISPAGFTPNPDDSFPSPAVINFQWDTRCVHVRQRPYRVVFRVDDARPPNDRLTDFAETNILVIGPAPRLDTAIVLPNSAIRLEWQPYTCSNARNMMVYRRKGDFPFALDSCFTGPPPGFELAGSVDINTTFFVDDNDGEGLEKGPKYCYVIVADFPDGAESKPSPEKCAALPLDVPLITNVDVDQTGTSGVINVAWTQPLELDSLVSPPAYLYELFGNDQNNLLFSSNELRDTTFTWSGPNTEDTANRVLLDFYTTNNQLESTAEASSVFLQTTPGGQRVGLNWSADVPWSNNGQYHLIYRRDNQSGNYILIDSIFGENDSYSYLDLGQSNGIPLTDGEQYCYFVETRGSYYNDAFSKVLSNRSQIACDIPRDSTPPCPPVLTLDVPDCDSIFADKDCGSQIADLPNSNRLKWVPDLSDGCDTAIAEYRIYYRPNLNADYEFLESTFISKGINGCYPITASKIFHDTMLIGSHIERHTVQELIIRI
jgi:hypothetical protein